MKFRQIEKKKSKVSLEFEDERHTFLNLLKENAWKSGARQVSCIARHPYHSNPVLTVSGENAAEIIRKSNNMTEKQTKDFAAAARKAFK